MKISKHKIVVSKPLDLFTINNNHNNNIDTAGFLGFLAQKG